MTQHLVLLHAPKAPKHTDHHQYGSERLVSAVALVGAKYRDNADAEGCNTTSEQSVTRTGAFEGQHA